MHEQYSVRFERDYRRRARSRQGPHHPVAARPAPGYTSVQRIQFGFSFGLIDSSTQAPVPRWSAGPWLDLAGTLPLAVRALDFTVKDAIYIIFTKVHAY